MPGTRMPTNFPKGEDGKRVLPDPALLDAPTFAADRAEFARYLGGDEAAKEFLADPDAVTKALRDYVWSVGVNGGTAPAPADTGGPETAAPQPAPAARGARTGPGRAVPRTLCRGTRRPLGAAWAATTRTSFSTGPVSAWRPRRSCCASG